jgi:cadmium resistance transport/sequestration family protein
LTTFLASVIAFVTTNIDDIFVLIFLFSNPRLKRRNVVIGQFLGISSLIGISFIASFIGLVIDLKYVGLLGLVPIYIGLKSLSALRKQIGTANADLNAAGNALQQSLSVASITIANGGDNISIYIPLYATLTNVGKINMTIVFLIMTALWCLIAQYLSNHPVLKRSLEKYGHIVTPFIFILLGIYIMYESNTFDLL